MADEIPAKTAADTAAILAARLVGDELVAVTVDGQRVRGPAPKSLTA